MNATLAAVSTEMVFFALSLAGAWVVLNLLKGSANIRHKGARFGGTAAMFVAMFLSLNWYVFDCEPESSPRCPLINLKSLR
jgi:hypothetical protein